MEYEEYVNSREAQERNLKNCFRCASCGYEYETYPGSEDSDTCPCCGGCCEFAGESYNA